MKKELLALAMLKNSEVKNISENVPLGIIAHFSSFKMTSYYMSFIERFVILLVVCLDIQVNTLSWEYYNGDFSDYKTSIYFIIFLNKHELFFDFTANEIDIDHDFKK